MAIISLTMCSYWDQTRKRMKRWEVLPKVWEFSDPKNEISLTKSYQEMEVMADCMWSGMQQATTLKLAKNKCIKDEQMGNSTFHKV